MVAPGHMPRIAIYAHYDGQGVVKPYVTYYLERLARVCDRVDFVSTAALGEAEIDKVRPFCEKVWLRDNVGFDFGMWQHALRHIDLTEWDELVLTNSSMFGPIFPLEEMFDEMGRHEVDFWGATDNEEMDWHIQSYFVVFRRRAHASEAFGRFWSSILPYRNKNQVIRAYEVGLSQHLREAGLRGEAYIPVHTLFLPPPFRKLLRNTGRSPTTFYPMRLLRRRMPFVKADTLRDNPGNVDRKRLMQAMREHGYDTGMVVFDRPSSRPAWSQWVKAALGR